MSRRSFLAGLSLALAGIAGIFAYRSAKRRRPVKLTTPPGNLAILGAGEPYDVCIIGSGPAGMTLGKRLVDRGVRTIVVESGFDLAGPGQDPRRSELEQFQNSGAIDYPIAATRVRAVGGTSTVWTGRCSRLHPLDFENNAYTPPGAPWPITYDELRPYYYMAEKTLRVRGGDLSSFHAPRRHPLPLPGDLNISNLKAMMSSVGITLDDSPTATGMQGESPFRVARDLVPAFLKSPQATLLSGVTVTRLLPEPGGRIAGAEVRNFDRESQTVRARVYVVACGGLESARLLLLSRSPSFPAGIGNRYDRVGRGFMEHPNIGFTGKVGHNWGTLSPGYELARSHQFYEPLKREGLGSAILVFIQSWVYRDDLSKWDLQELKNKAGSLIDRIQHAELRIGATMEMRSADANRVTLSNDLKDYFGNPVSNLSLKFSAEDVRTRERVGALIRKIYGDLGGTELRERGLTWSHHHMGSCRMGDDPKTSVTDRNLRVHESPNLYVAGSAGFVTSGAAHPTLGIVALSHRLAEHLETGFAQGKFGPGIRLSPEPLIS